MQRFAAIPLAAALAAAPCAAQGDSLRGYSLDTLALVLRAPLAVVRAPYALTLLRGPELARARPGLALDQALLLAPGVQVDNRHNPALGERVSVRGFGARAQFGVRGVRVLVDGLPATFPDGQSALNHVDPADLARVEVVRGPVAALYGNASGGVIRLESPAPPAHGFAAGLRGSAGGDGSWRTQGTLAGGGSGRWYRASATRLSSDGYRRHARADGWSTRGGAGAPLGAGELSLAWSWVDYDAENPGSLSDSLLRVDRRQAFARNLAQRTGERGRQGQAGARWTLEGPLRVDLSGYGTLRRIDNPIPAAVVALDRRVAGARAELGGGAGALRWTVGGELEDQADDRQNYVNDAGARGALLLDQVERVRAAAGFALATLRLPGDGALLAAVRHDRFRFSARDRLPATADNPDDSGIRSFSAWSPSVGVSEGLGALHLYANLSTAFETPTTTELVNRPDTAGGFNPGLSPQRTTAVEGGVKARLGGRGFAELSVYRARVRDQLVPFEVEGAPGRVFFRNAGLSRHQGMELSAGIEPAGGVRLQAAYSYLDARFLEYSVGGTDVGGNRVPGIAPHRLALSAWWGGAAGPFAGAELRAVASTPVSDRDDAGTLRSPGYTLVDLRAGWAGLALGRVRATPWGALTNALDRRYNASVVVNAFGGRYYEPGPGRALYLGMDLAAGAVGR